MKDLKAKDWVNYFKNPVFIGKDNCKIAEFSALLRDKARSWFATLDTAPGLDLKKGFLKQFNIKGTNKTVGHNFKNLKQGPQENVKDFYVRLAEVFKKMATIFPEDLKTVHYAVNEDQIKIAKAVKNVGEMDTILFIMEQMFLAGMHKKLQTKVQGSAVTGLLQVHDKADDIESFEQEAKHMTLNLAPIQWSGRKLPQYLQTSPTWGHHDQLRPHDSELHIS